MGGRERSIETRRSLEATTSATDTGARLREASTSTLSPLHYAPGITARDTPRGLLSGRRAFWLVAVALALVSVAGIGALVARIAAGDTSLGSWGYAAATLTFLLSTAHAPPLLAFATRAADGFWAVPIRRACELFGLAGLVTTPLFVLLLVQLPAPAEGTSIWSAWPGPSRFWDGLAVATLGLLGLALLYLGSLPDVAALRDTRSSRALGGLGLGWRGTTRQWRLLSLGLVLLGALYGLLYLLVQLIVAAELSLFLVPGWHSGILPAQSVVGGLQAGMAATILVLAALRRHGALRRQIGPAQFRPAAALLLVFSLLWFYLLWSEFLTYWYGRTPREQWLLALLMFDTPLALFVVSVGLNFVLPVLLLAWGSVRNSIAGPTLVAAVVLVGSLVDRVRVQVVAWSTAELAANLQQVTPAATAPASPFAAPAAVLPRPTLSPPDLADVLVLLGGPAAVALLYVLAARMLPSISLWEWNAGRLRRFLHPYGVATVAVVAERSASDGRERGLAHFSWNRIRDDLLRFSLRTPRWFWWAVGGLLLPVTLAAISLGLLMVFGLQLLGHTQVQQWAVPIVNFSFWSGVSHAGITVSAILRLNRSEWRRPITRAAETLAIIAVINSALFAIFHTGRPWRTFYWLFPYDFSRNLWPSVRSMLVWDATALLAYLIGTVLFVYATLLPDLAVARDAATGWRRSFFGVLALGYRGTLRQWQMQGVAARLLASLLLLMFVTDHSIVAWDLSMALVPGWHTTILAPYFISGAVYSGLAAVVIIMVAMRWVFRLGDYLTRDHFEFMARFLLLAASIWLFFFLTHLVLSVTGADPVELRIWEQRLLPGPYTGLSLVFLLTACLLPLPFWLVGRFRRSPAIMLGTALLVTLGMWLERYLLIMPPLSYKHPFVFTWDEVYEPSLIEYLLIVGPFALVALGLLVFARLFPLVPLFEVREGTLLERRLQIGEAAVPATIRETLETRA